MFFLGLIFTKAITRFGTGPCVFTGSIVTLVGFVISSLAVNVPMIIVFTGVVAGKTFLNVRIKTHKHNATLRWKTVFEGVEHVK